jgi:hypothetical protein
MCRQGSAGGVRIADFATSAIATAVPARLTMQVRRSSQKPIKRQTLDTDVQKFENSRAGQRVHPVAEDSPDTLVVAKVDCISYTD